MDKDYILDELILKKNKEKKMHRPKVNQILRGEVAIPRRAKLCVSLPRFYEKTDDPNICLHRMGGLRSHNVGRNGSNFY